jgi:hypothetical protein
MPDPLDTDSMTAEDLVAAISAERPRKSNKRRFTDAQLGATAKTHGDDTNAIAELPHVSISAINRGRIPLGLPRRVLWTHENRQKLLDLATRSPRPSNEEMAQEFGITVIAICTALSCNGITAGGVGNTPPDLAALKKRKCLHCERSFVAEHRYNFICRLCNDLIAAYPAIEAGRVIIADGSRAILDGPLAAVIHEPGPEDKDVLILVNPAVDEARSRFFTPGRLN